jgi:hypothetical protein
MEIQTLKYSVIEELTKINNPEIISRLRDYLFKLTSLNEPKIQSFDKFKGIWTKQEAMDFEKSIEDCEKINLDEW